MPVKERYCGRLLKQPDREQGNSKKRRGPHVFRKALHSFGSENFIVCRIMNKAILSFSGGQDSTTVLLWALKKYDYVETMGFDYGQRHDVELQCRKQILEKIRKEFPEYAEKLGRDTVVDVSGYGKVAESALTVEGEAIETREGESLPTSFVPGRNLLFMTILAARAYVIGAHTLLNGCNAVDFSGYPDCREDTMRALEKSLSLGCDFEFRIETPLMTLDKKEIWALAKEVGGERFVEFVARETHTCYEGDRTHWHDWGYGCGKCPACVLREHGFRLFRENAD